MFVCINTLCALIGMTLFVGKPGHSCLVISLANKPRVGQLSQTCEKGLIASSYMSVLPPRTTRLPKTKQKTKLRGLSPHANYTDRAAAADRRS